VAGASYPQPVAADPLAVGCDPSAGNIAQGPPAIGSNAVACDPGAAPRRPRTRASRTGARAMFLANNYPLF